MNNKATEKKQIYMFEIKLRKKKSVTFLHEVEINTDEKRL